MENKISERVYFVGALDRKRKLFDAIIPLSKGTSYNSYLVVGSEKVALIDSVDPSKTKILLKNLGELGIKKIDYIISNHSEQDHSGSIKALLSQYPDSILMCSETAKKMLLDLLPIPENKISTVKDRETLSLGDKNLQFFYTPWVHWPETMCTFLKEDKIIFSGDLFGAHDGDFGLFANNEESELILTKEYYSQIMMPYAASVRKAIEILEGLDFEIIAPTHGPIFKSRERILSKYKEWITEKLYKKVVIIYTSMHGSTKECCEYFGNQLEQNGISYKIFDLEECDLGKVASELLDSSCLVIGSPAFNVSMHPNVQNALFIINSLKPKLKYVGIIGSYGWGSTMANDIIGSLKNIKAEFLTPILIKGYAKEIDKERIREMAIEVKKRFESS